MGYYVDYTLSAEASDPEAGSRLAQALTPEFERVECLEGTVDVTATGDQNHSDEWEKMILEILMSSCNFFRIEAKATPTDCWGYEFRDGKLEKFELELEEKNRHEITLEEVV